VAFRERRRQGGRRRAYREVFIACLEHSGQVDNGFCKSGTSGLAHRGVRTRGILFFEEVLDTMATKQLLQFELEDGSSIFVEVSEGPGEAYGPRRVGRGVEASEQAVQRFNETIARVRPAAEAVLKTFQGLNTPDEIALEFGIKFNATAGVVLASVDSEATFNVSLKWTNK
jgi:hypothetical protein